VETAFQSLKCSITLMDGIANHSQAKNALDSKILYIQSDVFSRSVESVVV